MSNEIEKTEKKEVEQKVSRGVSAGIIANGMLVLAIGILVGVTKGKILKKLL